MPAAKQSSVLSRRGDRGPQEGRVPSPRPCPFDSEGWGTQVDAPHPSPEALWKMAPGLRGEGIRSTGPPREEGVHRPSLGGEGSTCVGPGLGPPE